MKLRVGVVGATGYIGAEALRLLMAHPMVEIGIVTARDSAGKDLGEVRPAFSGLGPLLVQPTEADRIADSCDVAYLALPHGTSAPLAAQLLERGLRVFDLGSDFRLKRPEDHLRYYQREAPPQALLDEVWYGLPELTGPPPPGTRLVSCPGCFATAMCLALGPLAAGMEQGARVSVFGATGSSGSGISPIPGVHHSTRTTGFLAYKPLVHQHMGELNQLLRSKGGDLQVAFVPHSAPMVRGIFVTAVFETASHKGSVAEALRRTYEPCKLVDFREGPVNVGWAIQSMRSFVGCSEAEGSTAVFVGIDNLLKGGAGQGVQALNVLMGWEEDLGLPLVGAFP